MGEYLYLYFLKGNAQGKVEISESFVVNNSTTVHMTVHNAISTYTHHYLLENRENSTKIPL